MKILVVEDEKDFSNTLKQALSLQLEANVEIVDNLRSIQSSAEKYQPDIILLDLGLGGAPEESGFPALKNLKRGYRTKHIPVIIMTGNRDKEYLMEAAKLGINDYVIKPPELDDFIQRIKKVCSLKKDSSDRV